VDRPLGDIDELRRLAAQLPQAELERNDLLDDAGRALGIDWPADYQALVRDHNGVEGDIGDWLLVLTPVEDLVERNTDPVMEFFPGLVIFGGDGGGEALAFDRETREVLLVPWIGDQGDWLILGATLTEAFQRMERGRVWEAPLRSSQTS
jgi:hypothetical protein